MSVFPVFAGIISIGAIKILPAKFMERKTQAMEWVRKIFGNVGNLTCDQ